MHCAGVYCTQLPQIEVDHSVIVNTWQPDARMNIAEHSRLRWVHSHPEVLHIAQSTRRSGDVAEARMVFGFP